MNLPGRVIGCQAKPAAALERARSRLLMGIITGLFFFFDNPSSAGQHDLSETGSSPIHFFTNVAQRLLITLSPELNLRDVEIHPVNRYTPEVHRLLQVAANLYESLTNRTTGQARLPTVFRPLFTSSGSRVAISGYVEETGSRFVSNRWFDLNLREDRELLRGNYVRSNANVFGQPIIIGAKKGFPNFNEFSLETVVQVARKLEIRKLVGRSFQTNQAYLLSISNVIGVEAWNSYTQALSRPVEIHIRNQYAAALDHAVDGITSRLHDRKDVFENSFMLTTWPGRNTSDSFVLSLHTNISNLTNSVYHLQPPHLFTSYPTNAFESNFHVPVWHLHVTNRLQFWIIDQESGRIIDFVNLEGLGTDMNISQWMFTGGSSSSTELIREADLWRTNRITPDLPDSPTLGIVNQMAASLGDPRVASDVWQSHAALLPSLQRKAEILKFMSFLLNPSNTDFAAQAPFVPVRKLYQRLSWQANDPLVHHLMADVSDPVLSSPDNANSFVFVRPAFSFLPTSNLRRMNERYRPWGGNPMRIPSGGDFDIRRQDSLVTSPDGWRFPEAATVDLATLGRIHRGTPWQTLYFKSHLDPTTGQQMSPGEWANWAGAAETHPTNDWRIASALAVLFRAQPVTELVSVNATNVASVLHRWMALTNVVATNGLQVLTEIEIVLDSSQMAAMQNGIDRVKSWQAGDYFQDFGDILSVPELSTYSPYIARPVSFQRDRVLTDDAWERIPIQLLPKLRNDPQVIAEGGGVIRVSLPEFVGQFFRIEQSRDLVRWLSVATNAVPSEEFISYSVNSAEESPIFFRVNVSLGTPTPQP